MTIIRLIVENDGDVAALRQAKRPDVLLVVADGNHHTLGVQLLEVLLLRQRISTFAVYPGLPVKETVLLARSRSPRVVAISAAMPEQLESAVQVARQLADLPASERPRVIVGGLALRGRSALPMNTPLLLGPEVSELIELASR